MICQDQLVHYELSKKLVENGHKVYLITSKRDNHQATKNGWTKERWY